MAGKMAVALAGPRFGIRYTTEGINNGNPAQLFVYGLIDTNLGTCATMPVLYLAIGHRLHWPLHAVVSKDHMWTRWDDGKPGGQRFNLEATNAKSNGVMGSFSSLSDEAYAEWLHTPKSVIESGSDFTSLTARQLLGVFLQGRGAVWLEHGRCDQAAKDFELAVKCFPENVDIRQCLRVTQGKDHPAPWRTANPRAVDVDAINSANEMRIQRESQNPLARNPAATWQPQ